MGCGQSKIDKIYPRKRKRRNGSKTSAAGEADADEEVEEAEQGGGVEDEDEDERKKAAIKARQLVSAGPLSAHSETSSSQLDFFRMLDEKIANGPDYDASSAAEIAAERVRLAALIRGWEAASTTPIPAAPRTRSLPATPSGRKSLPQSPLKTAAFHRPVSQQNGDLYSQQQQQQQQHYYHQFQMQQYQSMQRGQFFMPQQSSPPQYPRVYTQMNPANFQNVPIPPQQASVVVQYRKSRGVYTELA